MSPILLCNNGFRAECVSTYIYLSAPLNLHHPQYSLHVALYRAIQNHNRTNTPSLISLGKVTFLNNLIFLLLNKIMKHKIDLL